MLLVATGGGVGAGLRWIAAETIPGRPDGFPTAITAVNVVGSFLLGLVVGAELAGLGPFDIRPFTVGLLAGFTTFSTWMVDIDDARDIATTTSTILIPLILGVLAAGAGVATGQTFV